MDFFWRILRRQPQTVPGDRVIPLRFWDDRAYFRSSSHDYTFRFDDVLDITKLRGALERLMEMGGWRQVGARLRLNANGDLEYHIPPKYTEQRPAFMFTSTKYGMGIDQHPDGSRLPKTSDHPFLAPSPSAFGALVRHADSPRLLDDWLYSDRPQLHIHVVQFQDATLLTVSHPHTLTDAGGRWSLLHAWIAVLEGREGDVPSFEGFQHDPLASLGVEVPKQQYLHFGQIVTGLRVIGLVFRYALEHLWYPRQEDRAICLPGQFVDRMRDTARQGLVASSDSGPPAFLSDGDVLIAWWTRTVVTALRPALHRTVMLLNVVDIRSLFPSWFQPRVAYIGNAASPSYTLFRVHQCIQGSLGSLASHNRQALIRHRTVDQVQALAAVQRESRMRATPLIGDSSSLVMACSNLHKGRWFDLDFSAAVVRPGIPLDQRANALGRPSYINVIEHTNGYPSRNVTRILGKDAAGNWWLTCGLRRGAWSSIEKQLLELGKKAE